LQRYETKSGDVNRSGEGSFSKKATFIKGASTAPASGEREKKKAHCLPGCWGARGPKASPAGKASCSKEGTARFRKKGGHIAQNSAVIALRKKVYGKKSEGVGRKNNLSTEKNWKTNHPPQERKREASRGPSEGREAKRKVPQKSWGWTIKLAYQGRRSEAIPASAASGFR